MLWIPKFVTSKMGTMTIKTLTNGFMVLYQSSTKCKSWKYSGKTRIIKRFVDDDKKHHRRSNVGVKVACWYLKHQNQYSKSKWEEQIIFKNYERNTHEFYESKVHYSSTYSVNRPLTNNLTKQEKLRENWTNI